MEGGRNQVEGMHYPGPGGSLLVGNLELAAVGSLELAEEDNRRKAGRMLVVVHNQQEEG